MSMKFDISNLIHVLKDNKAKRPDNDTIREEEIMSRDTQGPHQRWGFDRRDILKGLAGATALSAMPHAALGETPKEAPALAKQAADGKLPPLAERIPANPLVIAVEKAGRYGGSLRRGL